MRRPSSKPIKRTLIGLPYWDIMHDGIQKILIEYNGMILQTINPETYGLVLVAFRLMKMHGGVNAYNNIESLMNASGELLDIKNSAYKMICTIDGFENVIRGEIPVYFKLGVIKEINKNCKEIHIAMSDRLPSQTVGVVYLLMLRLLELVLSCMAYCASIFVILHIQLMVDGS